MSQICYGEPAHLTPLPSPQQKAWNFAFCCSPCLAGLSWKPEARPCACFNAFAVQLLPCWSQGKGVINASWNLGPAQVFFFFLPAPWRIDLISNGCKIKLLFWSCKDFSCVQKESMMTLPLVVSAAWLWHPCTYKTHVRGLLTSMQAFPFLLPLSKCFSLSPDIISRGSVLLASIGI